MHSRYQHQLLWSTWHCLHHCTQSCIKEGLAELTTVEQTTIMVARQQCSYKQVCITWRGSALDCIPCEIKTMFPLFQALDTQFWKNTGLTVLATFLVFTDSKRCPFKLTFKFGNWESLLERDQDCRIAVESLEFCLLQETSAGLHHVHDSIVTVKKPAVFVPKFQSCLCSASCRCCKTVT
jgi:hypothetical protein